VFPPTNFSYSSGGLSNDFLGHLTYNNEFFYSPNGENWMSWGQGGGTKGIDLYANTFNASSMIREWFNGLNVGSTWCGHTIGRDTSSNDSFGLCFHYTGASSATNYYSVRNTTGTDLFKAFANGDFAVPGLTNQATIGTDANGKLVPGTTSSAFSALTGSTNTTAAMVVGSGASVAPSGTGTIQATNISGTVTASSPIAITGAGTTASPYNVACPTCGTGTGGTSVSQDSGSAETNLPITGFMPQVCSDTSASGTAQSCTVANTFVPQAGNCIVYQTTTANGGTGLTINVNSLGAKSVAIPGSSGFTTTLTANVIPANKPQLMCYDGTNWNDQQTGTVSAGGYPTAVTLTASNSSTLDFTTCISSSYKNYRLYLDHVILATSGSNLLVRVSSNGGSTFDAGSNYKTGRFFSQVGSASGSFTGSSETGFNIAPGGPSANVSPGISGEVDLIDPGFSGVISARYWSTALFGSNYFYGDGGYIYTGSSVPVNALRVVADSGNITSGTVTCQPLPQ
jgi:hypothetical protein